MPKATANSVLDAVRHGIEREEAKEPEAKVNAALAKRPDPTMVYKEPSQCG